MWSLLLCHCDCARHHNCDEHRGLVQISFLPFERRAARAENAEPPHRHVLAHLCARQQVRVPSLSRGVHGTFLVVNKVLNVLLYSCHTRHVRGAMDKAVSAFGRFQHECAPRGARARCAAHGVNGK